MQRPGGSRRNTGRPVWQEQFRRSGRGSLEELSDSITQC